MGMRFRRIRQQVRDLLVGSGSDDDGPWSEKVRAASQFALKGANGDGKRASHLARDAVLGAIDALTEIGGEATGFAKDAVIGVIQGTSEVSKSTRPIIRDAVEGAIRGSNEAGVDVEAAGTDAVGGAIEGAISVGVEPDRAISEASSGAFEAITQIGIDVGSAAKAAIVGVITGVSATGGNVPRAIRETATRLVSNSPNDPARVAHMCRSIVEGALDVQNVDPFWTIKCVRAAAEGAIDGAYDVSEEAGEHTRSAIAGLIRAPGGVVDPLTMPLLDDLSKHVAVYHPQGPGAWRAKALWHAGRSLISIGGIDLAASLAFFTLLSFFPLVALIILAFAAFADPTTIKTGLADAFLYFFPASEDFFNTAVDHLFSARFAVGVVAAVGILIGANGLFMAANRSVNRIFGVPPRKMLGTTLLELALGVGIVLIFLTSIGLTIVFQLALNVSEALPVVGGPINRVIVVVTGTVSAILPLFLSAIVFGIVYRTLPNTYVRSRDATFGAIVAVILFEVVKHAFFWFGNVTGQQNLLYLPFSSVVLLLIWAFLAGLIFLFGASLAKEASNHRPRALPDVARNGTHPTSLE